MIQTCEHIRMFLWQHSFWSKTPINISTQKTKFIRCHKLLWPLVINFCHMHHNTVTTEAITVMSSRNFALMLQLTHVRKCWYLKRLNLYSAAWFVCQCLSICCLLCVYIHKQALWLPVGQDVGVAFGTGPDTECTAELYSDIFVKGKKKQKNPSHINFKTWS